MNIFEQLWLWFGLPATPRREHGATLIEYVLIVAVIAIAVFVGASEFGLATAIKGLFTKAATTISTNTSPSS